MRVLKAHREAVLSALPDAPIDDLNKFAEVIALAVIGAEDDLKTRYCVLAVNPTGSVETYGPYATHAAAMNAIQAGVVGTHPQARAGVFPLIPAPKVPRKKTTKPKEGNA